MKYPSTVICGNCGAIFNNPIQIHGVVQDITLQNNFATCPNCRQYVRLPELIRASVQGTTKLLLSEPKSIKDIQQLIGALEDLKNSTELSQQQISEKLKSINLDSAEQIAESAPSKSSDAKIWAGVMVAAISYAFREVPDGILSWITLFERVQTIIGH